jgi:predicted alpha/beta superfamily hydrolase
MKLRWTLLALAALAAPAFAKPPLPAKPAGYVIPGSEVRTFPANAAGRRYALFVGLPASYAAEPNRRYPVLFVTDGYWDFIKMTGIGGTLSYDRVVPEFIIVAMGYDGDNLNYGDMRRWELSPVPNGDPATSGHAKDFLDTIETVFIPFIDKEYRTDPNRRVLAGASLGGLFTLYSMYAKPGLFQGYIAATPAILLEDSWIMKFEDEFAKAGKSLDARLYMTVGGNESPWYLDGVMRMNQRISNRKSPKLAYDFRVIDGERHAGGQIEAYTRGLRFVFAPWAPESGPPSDVAPPR